MNDHDHEEPLDTTENPCDVPPVDNGFHVVDEQSANWVVRKISESRRYADRVRAWAAAEIRRAEREEQFLLRRFGSELEIWCRAQIDANCGRRRSVNLPAGRVGMRSVRATLRIVDDHALLAWCRRNLPGAIQITERLVKAPLQHHLDSTGELPPGTDVMPAGDRFYVERPGSTG